ncbi:MAG: acyl-CoA thioesterase [Pseudonocardiales bacterium]|nr:acyl-CoA thioesterase [Pseudonocardiales bacterium]MDT7606111.1 acyl-CoA thioesterase [Pseudonocardiales bacterium]MDT7626509.1 acyl-CoA thioesterase [Pseudonocardiales bacterium]MDT7633201.1 acyl-CoA thioesterase [Pseudonocardiales bacterium]MDT7639599.1 acyl-CoA thioesterase [Pseudonocardiales bacterium]
MLQLERIEENLFRGWCHQTGWQRAFGGQVAAQALTAAGATVPEERGVHSLHGYFIRGGRTDRPIVFEVERTRDGGSFTTRRVVAIQDGETIFSLSASFQRAEVSSEHQARMPEVTAPEDGDIELFEPLPIRQSAIEARYIGDPTKGLPDVGRGPRQQLWVRAKDRLPDEPLAHVCALTYISDIRLAGTAGLPHQAEPGEPQLASLDHAVWFHRPFRADEWLLFDMESPSYASHRGLAHGEFFTVDGRLVASVTQEVLIRRR